MDRNSIIGLSLITVLILIWLVYMSYQEVPIPKNTPADTTQVAQLPPKDTLAAVVQKPDSAAQANKYGVFTQFTEQMETLYTVETDLYTAVFSSKGAALKSWTLKKFKKWDKKQVQLIAAKEGELYLNFVTLDAKAIDSRDLNFQMQGKGKTSFKLSKDKPLVLDFVIDLGNNRKIIKSVSFYADKYHIDQNIVVENLDEIIPARGYNLVWEKGLNYQEYNSVDESSNAETIVQMNGEVEEINAEKDKSSDKSLTGIIDFSAVKIKYFTAAIIPQPWQKFDGTVDIESDTKHHKNEGVTESYTMSFRVPYKGGKQTNGFQVYIGPLDYNIVDDYGLNATINLGWRFLIRPIGEYFMLPIFRFIHKFVPNYGVVIILFSLIIKILLHPLSITQMKSAQKMQLLTPEMEKIRAKYKDDQSTQQKEIMKLYSQYGINPAGGCLPLFLQMPILFALWAVLRSAIELRQAPFMWWITDLSVPDRVFGFGFSFLGISHLSGLALLMGITMFVQQKMTITDPRQKAMVYMMPVMFTFMFANFPSGLNLYYFFFNLLAISQQFYINKLSKNKPTLAELKKSPKKEGWIQKKMREAQDLAESQGRTLPGQKGSPKLSSGSSTSPKANPPKKRKK